MPAARAHQLAGRWLAFTESTAESDQPLYRDPKNLSFESLAKLDFSSAWETKRGQKKGGDLLPPARWTAGDLSELTGQFFPPCKSPHPIQIAPPEWVQLTDCLRHYRRVLGCLKGNARQICELEGTTALTAKFAKYIASAHSIALKNGKILSELQTYRADICASRDRWICCSALKMRQRGATPHAELLSCLQQWRDLFCNISSDYWQWTYWQLERAHLLGLAALSLLQCSGESELQLQQRAAKIAQSSISYMLIGEPPQNRRSVELSQKGRVPTPAPPKVTQSRSESPANASVMGPRAPTPISLARDEFGKPA